MLTRGPHVLSIVAPKTPLGVISVAIAQKAQPPSAEKLALHYRLFGMKPGETPLAPRKAAQQLLAGFLRKAYRRPVEQGEIEPFLKLYDRSAERGDPYEERVKLALSGVLVSPKFLFRVERANPAPGIHPLRDHEIATRLSYFLWSTMPDEELYAACRRRQIAGHEGAGGSGQPHARRSARPRLRRYLHRPVARHEGPGRTRGAHADRPAGFLHTRSCRRSARGARAACSIT